MKRESSDTNDYVSQKVVIGFHKRTEHNQDTLKNKRNPCMENEKKKEIQLIKQFKIKK